MKDINEDFSTLAWRMFEATGDINYYLMYKKTVESEEDKMDYSRQNILDKICVCFAGRVAEQLVYGEDGITTGARADFQHARALAQSLIDEYGMDMDFLLGMSEAKSETTKRLFDRKLNSLLKEQYVRAKELILHNRKALEALTEKLMRDNSLDSQQIESILNALIKSKDRMKKISNFGEAVV